MGYIRPRSAVWFWKNSVSIVQMRQSMANSSRSTGAQNLGGYGAIIRRWLSGIFLVTPRNLGGTDKKTWFTKHRVPIYGLFFLNYGSDKTFTGEAYLDKLQLCN